jgi:hypothetical protein
MNKISPDMAAAILAGFNLADEMVIDSPASVPTSVAAFFRIHGADVRRILEEMSQEPEALRRGREVHKSMTNPQNHFYAKAAEVNAYEITEFRLGSDFAYQSVADSTGVSVPSGNCPVDVKGIMDNAIRNARNGWPVDPEALTAARDATLALIESDKGYDLARYHTYTRRGLEKPEEGEKRIRDAENRRYRNLSRVWGD